MLKIGIVDTGCANISSVRFALDRLGQPTIVSGDVETLQDMDKLILPGVGAAAHAMQKLKDRNLVSFLQTWDKPLMGICLGMQLLFSRSEEGGDKLLGIIDADILELDSGDKPLPHMGWNRLTLAGRDPILKGLSGGEYVYFVHSYAAPVGNYTVAQSVYGQKFSAIVRKDNFWGCQFHPERSSKIGAQVLASFVEDCA